jgi:hypothetical protein
LPPRSRFVESTVKNAAKLAFDANVACHGKEGQIRSQTLLHQVQRLRSQTVFQ